MQHIDCLSSWWADGALLQDGQLDTLALWQGHVWAVALANHEHIAQTGGEGVASGVLQVDDVEGALVALAGHNHTDAASVLATLHHSQVAGLELEEVGDLASVNVDLDRVVDLDRWVRVADGAAVVGRDVRDALGAV